VSANWVSATREDTIQNAFQLKGENVNLLDDDILT